ncbi:DUF805 domain-containing protein [Sphingobium nicotianae]|uniref:DUF805 domain-containing protein n=1 Tax=Sphingobium nicotianae TaxID=2782607 RepID=A0A9X1IRN2_9SPHN|nr:DUF805 domain-containing protein [Sphingobium nicotianae]MBT2187454.1 DUF805 domain-containing protein [Sphingobium nicotianae]
MAYGDSGQGNSILQTVRLTFDATGRARRTDLIYFGLVSGFVSAIVTFVLSGNSFIVDTMMMAIVPAIVGVPFYALFARRLHDQGRSGWWALLIIPSVMAALWKQWHFATAPFDELDKTSVSDWIGAPFSLAVFVLAFLPPQEGSNQYGANPRVAA